MSDNVTVSQEAREAAAGVHDTYAMPVRAEHLRAGKDDSDAWVQAFQRVINAAEERAFRDARERAAEIAEHWGEPLIQEEIANMEPRT